MTWSLFTLYCQEMLRLCNEGQTTNTAFHNAKTSPALNMFGDKALSSTAEQLINQIREEPDQTRAQRALSIYAKVQLKSAHGSSKAVNTIYYIIAVLFVYLITATVYNLFAVPAISELHQTLEAPIPAVFITFKENFILLTSLILFCSALFFTLQKMLKKALQLAPIKTNSIGFYFLPKSIKFHYLNARNLLTLPLKISSSQPSPRARLTRKALSD